MSPHLINIAIVCPSPYFILHQDGTRTPATITASAQVQNVTGSFIPEGSGSYAIKDIATNEFVVPFSAYTSMSCDSNSPYFIQWLDGFYPDRAYKVLLKLKYSDGQEQVFDDDFEFIVKRS